MDSPKLYLTKRNNGIYYIGYYESSKLKWKSTKSRLKTEAHIQLSDIKNFITSKPKEISLPFFISEFLSFADQSFARSTGIIYRVAFRHLENVAGNLPLTNLHAQHFDKYKTFRLSKVKAVTVNKELKNLRAAFNTALRWKYITINPMCNVTNCIESVQTPAFFTRKDFDRLLSLIKEQWLKEIVIFAVCAGMRKGEIINLKWNNIDFDRRTITIESNATFKVKNGKRRVIPMNNICYHLLRTRSEKNISDFVFSINEKQIYGYWLTHLFKRYIRLAGLSERLKFHSLRATFASWLVMSGTDIYAVSKLLGHSDVSVTTKHYAHLKPETLTNEVNKISFVLN
ncbi:MAG: site-specific integrase [Ignavibacteriales bacterium]|nr:site-specific integrase [Ignavibacteriales bacterium]